MKKAVLLGLILLSSGCEKAFLPEPDSDPVGVYEELWRTFDELYAVFPERGVDWNATYSQFKPAVNDGLSDDSLFRVLTAMLEPLDDAHVQLVTPGQRAWSSNRVYRELLDNDLFRLEVVKQNYLTNVRTKGEEESLTTYGLVSGQPIGYIHFPTISDTWTELDEMLSDMGSIEGLIIDLRHNEGGDFTWALNELDQLNGTARTIYRSRTKNGPGPDDYTGWTDWQLDGGPGTRAYRIVFITDRYTVSAGERLVMMLRAMDNTVHLGDTTNGALSTVIWRELPNAWYYRVSIQQVEDPQGIRWEGIGLPPQQVVLNASAQLDAGVDAQLQAAIDAF
ncbi:MAG: S41 family peptidase [Flavobacteriales bacterium]|nr:S41 family peptidase [Flavobacteriales bacterium]